jgi:hypothetical protein
MEYGSNLGSLFSDMAFGFDPGVDSYFLVMRSQKKGSSISLACLLAYAPRFAPV